MTALGSEALERLPRRPGVYIYRNAAGKTIYIGKAKSLRQRVRSYFQPSAQHPPRIARMVSEVAELEFIVVDTEMEALILESNLVKKQRPRYNVVLRDDKHFPYLKLSVKDAYPRVSLIRRARLDGSVYVGPFVPSSTARRSLKLVQRYFRVATCREVFDGKRRPCLYYHLDQCLAPCAGKTTEDEYGAAVEDARMFLEGRHTDLRRSLRRRMDASSRTKDYEAAARYRDALRTVDRLAVRQQMSSVGLEEQDYLAHHCEGDQIALQLFQMREGKIQARREFAMDPIEFDAGSFYAAVLVQYYGDNIPPRDIYLPHVVQHADLLSGWLSERRGHRVRLHVPRRGVKRRFLQTVERNAAMAFQARFRGGHTHDVAALEELARVLGLDEPPYRIECFDISNLQGSDTVASMVVCQEGKMRKSDYRHYNIRGMSGPDDLASMAQVVTRRYRRLLAEERRLPDLVLIDGGRGQLGAALLALTAVGLPMLPVVAIAKREEELFRQGRSEPIRLDRGSPALRLIQRLRDEAHRFAVTHHRKRRGRRTLGTALTEIAGVGPVTARKLLREFGSLAGVRRANPQVLRRIVGKRVAGALEAHFATTRRP